jgi:FMN phosphatase YigB (HAD superfamily)/lambda repressor-like predicted transcriptional regulator
MVRKGGFILDEKSLGVKIGEARRRAGLTQQQLCQKSGLSYSTLAKIERGAIKSPSVFTIQQVASAIGMSLDELIGAPAGVKSTKKRSNSGIEFVYFDVNGCLVHFYHRAFAAIARDTGVSSDVVETVYWHYNDAVCRGDTSIDEYNQILADKFGVKKFEWNKYYLEAVEPIKETKEVLEWAAEHYNVGLLTNIMPGLVDGLKHKGYLPDLNYAAVIDSSEVGAIKPESTIFEIATEKSGVDPKSILLIDDARANLMAAEQHGWRVLWFDDYRPKESIERIKTALEF